jgi:hypothetical protein
MLIKVDYSVLFTVDLQLISPASNAIAVNGSSRFQRFLDDASRVISRRPLASPGASPKVSCEFFQSPYFPPIFRFSFLQFHR